MRTQQRGPKLADHIAKVAADLFYREGIHEIGVDRIALVAGVTKRTMYRYFRSKDALVVAALRYFPLVPLPSSGEPGEQMLRAYVAAANFLTETICRGCPHMIVAAELVDQSHPARAIVRERVRLRERWFTDRAREAGIAAPEILGEQLNTLLDGFLTSATKKGEVSSLRVVQAVASALIADARRRSTAAAEDNAGSLAYVRL